MLKKYNEFLLLETRNIAQSGDWLIRAKTKAGEQYVIREFKFPQLYNISSVKEPKDKKVLKDGFMEYGVIPDERKAVICNRKTLDKLKDELGESESPFTQKRMLEVLKDFKKVNVRKQKSVYAKQVSQPIEVITKVKEGKPMEIWFKTSWDDVMPIAEDDVLIVNDEEVYRIAIAEFNQTYEK